MTIPVEQAKVSTEVLFKSLIEHILNGGLVGDKELMGFIHHNFSLLNCEFTVYSTGSAFKVRE